MSQSVSRRAFLKSTAAGAAMAMTATSYSRILGANDRILLGQIGCGNRGVDAHIAGVHPFDKAENCEFVAVCDPWRVARENAAAKVKEWYNREAKMFSSYRELLALKEVDAVMIASCDHQHTTHLKAAAEAGKDAYCEKPLAKGMAGLVAAVDAVKKAGTIVQIGTQLRSMASFTGCRDLFKTGVFGMVSRIEQCRNTEQPYWYGYVKEVKKEDVDWKEFLMGLPDRPFDPVQYSGWYGYRDFSDGPVTGYGSHYIDLVHYITGASFPTSCVSLGGTFTWKDERKFTCPDHAQALWIYPEGFMVTYSSNLGNGAGSTFKLFGDQGMMDMVSWTEPTYSAEGGPKRKGDIRGVKRVPDVACTDHFLNWLQCLRTRKSPNASIDAGYQHAVACLMAIQAFDTGKRIIYDRDKRQIIPG